MRWNGRSWRADPGAVPFGARADLLGVACVRAGICTIVGDRGSAAFAERSQRACRTAELHNQCARAHFGQTFTMPQESIE